MTSILTRRVDRMHKKTVIEGLDGRERTDETGEREVQATQE